MGSIRATLVGQDERLFPGQAGRVPLADRLSDCPPSRPIGISVKQILINRIDNPAGSSALIAKRLRYGRLVLERQAVPDIVPRTGLRLPCDEVDGVDWLFGRRSRA